MYAILRQHDKGTNKNDSSEYAEVKHPCELPTVDIIAHMRFMAMISEYDNN